MWDVADRREAIFATVEAYNRAHPQEPLPRPAARLLGVMFSPDHVCQRSLEASEAEGFPRKAVPGPLRALVAAGLLSKQEARRGYRTPTGCTCRAEPQCFVPSICVRCFRLW
jgi:hypothetical protein